ncbi:PTS sugar transporter subunit IIA [Frigidibacter sp. RF13]|uniref:PTS sugar transporter subunit IIA n=1 Tax=Frigidibacter sp. RF13 TaxID=2997340 RepID=UPI00226D6177|nr:PTS sugar transporter subunit IIA [Frigidibacter sp. RF13]MCY1128405.1 PTS sugar transporter subunit IIA [Frigidibacter sp. RF13]
MDLSSFLSPSAVRVMAGTASKKRLFQDLGDIAQAVYGLDGDTTFDALQERETLGPTGVGNGVALPHARLDGLEKMAGVFIRLERPVDFDSVDRVPVDLIFALFAPKDAGVEHLKALATVSRTLREEQTRIKLRQNSDPAALHAVLTDLRSIQAA